MPNDTVYISYKFRTLVDALRTIASILLLSILAFNWFGYRFVSQYLQDRVAIHLENKLDREEYAESDLVEIKMPLSLPYQNSNNAFERCYGEIKIQGIHYTYVKRKIYDGSLVLLCLPNSEKTKIVNAKDDFFKLVNGLQSAHSEGNSKKNNTTVYKNLLAEFLADESKLSIGGISLRAIVKFPATNTLPCLTALREIPEIPPEENNT